MTLLSNTGIRAGASAAGGDAYQIEKSLRFEDTDSACLKRTPSSSGNRQKWTLSFWFKKVDDGSATHFFSTYGSANDDGSYFRCWMNYVGRMHVSFWGYYAMTSTEFFTDPSSWYHCVVAMDTTQSTSYDRCKVWINGDQLTTLSAPAVATLNAEYGWNHNHQSMIGNMTNQSGVPSHEGNSYMAEIYNIDGQQLDPSSFAEEDETTGKWLPKKYAGTYGTNGFYLKFNGTDIGEDSSGNGNDWTAVNLTQSAPVISSPNLPSWSTADSGWSLSNSDKDAAYSSSGYAHVITGALTDSTTYHFYLSRNDGSNNYGGWFFTDTTNPSATVPDEFGGNSLGARMGESGGGAHGTYATANGVTAGQNAFSGWGSISARVQIIEFVVNRTVDKVWMRAAGDGNWIGGGDPSNTSSTASFLLPDGDTIYFGCVDYGSGGYANFRSQAGDITDVDVTTDSPTDFDDGGNGTGNYCTMNPLHHLATATLTQGNLKTTSSNPAFSTFLLKSGKWYVEHTVTADGYNLCFTQPDHPSGATPSTGTSKSIGWYNNGAFYWGAGNATLTNSYTTGDVIAAAIDMDGSTIKCYKNNNLETTIDFSTGTYHRFTEGMYISQFNGYGTWNFGARAFTYTPPTDYKALNTYNLPDPVITDPSKYFEAHAFTSTGSDSSVISGLNFSPDMVWGKSRNQTYDHEIVDIVRGGEKVLRPHSTAVESDYSSTPAVGSWNSDGITSSTNFSMNYGSGNSSVAWLWDAGTANESGIGSYDGSNFSGNGSVVTNGTLMNTWAKAFDGKTGSYSHGVYSYYTGDTEFTFDTSNKPTWSSKFRIFIRKYAGACYINGSSTDVTDDLSYSGHWEGWLDITSDVGSSGTLSSIKVTDVGNNYVALQAIELDGKILYDTPPSVAPGGLNGPMYDQSENWTDKITAVNGITIETTDEMFDGDHPTAPNRIFRGTGGVKLTHTFTGVTSIRVAVYVYSTYNYYEVNGSSSAVLASTASGWLNWITLTPPANGTVTSIEIGYNDTANYYCSAWEINGKLLIDDDVTTPDIAGYGAKPTIASTYRANPEAGFSIVSYTGNQTAGATIAHGLNAKTDFMIIKNRDQADPWPVYHKEMGPEKYLYLHTSGAIGDWPLFNDTDPDSNVFYVNADHEVNASGEALIAYCWSEVEGYSKFGTFTGNGSADGPFIYCGFRPKYILTKGEDANDWYIRDTVRSPFNVVDNPLRQDTGAEYSGREADILSNGFKLRTSDSQVNSNNTVYYYAAFAESPFKYSNAR